MSENSTNTITQTIDELNQHILEKTIGILAKIQTNIIDAVAKLNEKIIKDTNGTINYDVIGVGEIVSKNIIDEYRRLMDESCKDVIKLVESTIPTLPKGIRLMQKFPTVQNELQLKIKNYKHTPSRPDKFPQYNEEKIVDILRQRVAFIVNTENSLNYKYNRCWYISQVWILTNGHTILFAHLKKTVGIICNFSNSNISKIIKMYDRYAAKEVERCIYIDSEKLFWSPPFRCGCGYYDMVWGYYTGHLDDLDPYYSKPFNEFILPTLRSLHVQMQSPQDVDSYLQGEKLELKKNN